MGARPGDVGDDLFYAQRLTEHSLGHVILHSNLYLIALPMVLYKAMFEVFGIGDYLPYRLVAVGLSLLCAGLFYALAPAPDGRACWRSFRRSSCSSSGPAGRS